MQSISFPALLALLIVVCVIALAICLNRRVRTGLRIGWFSWFLETDRNEKPRQDAE